MEHTKVDFFQLLSGLSRDHLTHLLDHMLPNMELQTSEQTNIPILLSDLLIEF